MRRIKRGEVDGDNQEQQELDTPIQNPKPKL